MTDPGHDAVVGGQERRRARTTLLVVVCAVIAAFTLTHQPPQTPAKNTAADALPAAGRPGGTPQTTRRAGARLSAEAVRVSRRFLVGYLAYSYGQASISKVDDASPSLVGSLLAHRPLASAAMRARHPRVLSLTPAITSGGQLVVSASVTEGGIVHYPLTLLLARDHRRLLVSALENR